jgi:hypothetical protein
MLDRVKQHLRACFLPFNQLFFAYYDKNIFKYPLSYSILLCTTFKYFSAFYLKDFSGNNIKSSITGYRKHKKRRKIHGVLFLYGMAHNDSSK